MKEEKNKITGKKIKQLFTYDVIMFYSQYTLF